MHNGWTFNKSSICQVVTSLTGNGAENLVVQIALSLKKTTIPCSVIALFPPKSGTLVDVLREHQIPYFCCNYQRWYQFPLFFTLKKTINQIQPEIIHSHLFPADYYVSLLRKKDRILISTEHNVSNRRRHLPFLRTIDSFVYKQFNKIICISDAVKKSSTAWLPSCANSYITIPNGIDIERFKQKKNNQFRTMLNIPEDNRICAMVGRLENPSKDQATIIRAVKKVDNLHLILAGEGRDLLQLQELSKELQIENRIHFVGYTKNVEILLSGIDLYIHSTVFEGFGLSIFEALASGLPVIASNVEGTNNLLTDTVDALLFEQGNPESLVEKINAVLNSRELETRLIANGLETASKYSIQNMTDRYIALYENILKSNSNYVK